MAQIEFKTKEESLTQASMPHIQGGGSPTYIIQVSGRDGSRALKFGEPGPVSIGADSSNDIVLAGAGIEGLHLQLVIPKYPTDGIRVLPKAEPVEIVGFGLLEKGQFADVIPGTVIRIDDLELRISNASSQKKSDRWFARTLAAACVALIVALTWSWYVGLVSDDDGFQTALLENADMASQKSDIGAGSEPGEFDPERLEALAWTVRTQLEDLGIGDRVSVIPNLNGELKVIGKLTDRDEPAWNSFLQWYATRTGYPQLLQNIELTNAPDDVPELNSIWLDDKPSVIFRSGSIGQVGSEIENGWIVVSISRSAVVLTRDGEYVTLTF